MSERIDPHFAIKAGVHERCALEYRDIKDSARGSNIDRTIDLALMIQEERAKLYAGRNPGMSEDVEELAVDAAIKRYGQAEALGALTDHSRYFLGKYWAHSKQSLCKIDEAINNFVKKEQFQGSSILMDNGPKDYQDTVYGMAEDWAKRMQIRMRLDKNLKVADVAELSFHEAFAQIELDGLQKVRLGAGHYLSQRWKPEGHDNEFAVWFGSHRTAPDQLQDFDPKCRWREQPAWKARAKTSKQTPGDVATLF